MLIENKFILFTLFFLNKYFQNLSLEIIILWNYLCWKIIYEKSTLKWIKLGGINLEEKKFLPLMFGKTLVLEV